MDLKKNNNLLTIGKISRLSGLPKTTIRYYTEIGLLNTPCRSQGGYRLYPTGPTLDKLKKIKECAPKRISLENIKEAIRKELS